MGACAPLGPDCCGLRCGAACAPRVRVPRFQGTSASPGIARGRDRPPGRNVMLLSTMNDLPGYEVTEVLGEVFGITVRSRHVGSQIGAGFKSLVGGELRGMTKMLSDSRVEAQDRLTEAAQAIGGDAVLAMRFDASEFQVGQEICAYGTAVKIRRKDL